MFFTRSKKEKIIQFFLVIITLVMIILRFLLNEKGRVTPDSIRFFRTAEVFPIIDNTTTPLGYPLSLRFFDIFGIDMFWASKIIGILAFLFIIFFAWKKKFYFKETILLSGLFSFVSIYSFTLSEPLILPFVFVFLYVSRQIIIDELKGFKAYLYLSLMLILLYNIRYPALFFMGGIFLYGVLNFKKNYGKTFIYAGLSGFAFVVLYQILFVNYFNETYIEKALEIAFYPTSKLLKELLLGLTTTFNPFVHIANPNGGIINYGIYGIGFLNMILMVFLFMKNPLSETEKFMIFTGIIGIVCSYFIQYFYVVDSIDYRLLAPFIFPVWLVYFKKLYKIFGRLVYGIMILSLMTGFVFTWLSKGNYLENRRKISTFLKTEQLEKVPLKFYIKEKSNLNEIQIAELLSTVNHNIEITYLAKDTLQYGTLTKYKVLKKIKIDQNKHQ